MEQKKLTTRERVELAEIGTDMAFKRGEKMLCGTLVEKTDTQLTIRTKNNSIYYVPVEDVTWVKDGTFYPSGIFGAIKMTERLEREAKEKETK